MSTLLLVLCSLSIAIAGVIVSTDYPSSYVQSINITATVTPKPTPLGSVTFYDKVAGTTKTTLGTAKLALVNGVATAILSYTYSTGPAQNPGAENHTLTASYDTATSPAFIHTLYYGQTSTTISFDQTVYEIGDIINITAIPKTVRPKGGFFTAPVKGMIFQHNQNIFTCLTSTKDSHIYGCSYKIPATEKIGIHEFSATFMGSDNSNYGGSFQKQNLQIKCTSTVIDCNNDQICETNINTNVNNCGKCGTVCNLPNTKTHICQNKGCYVGTCDDGYGNCNASLGCETPLNTLSNCGGCNKVCNLPHATSTCSDGTCKVKSCDLGYADCNNNATDGCEINLTNDVYNCGKCNNACNLPHTKEHQCNQGICQIKTCDKYYADCDCTISGCETYLLSDDNCGKCGNLCNELPHTVTGKCVEQVQYDYTQPEVWYEALQVPLNPSMKGIKTISQGSQWTAIGYPYSYNNQGSVFFIQPDAPDSTAQTVQPTDAAIPSLFGYSIYQAPSRITAIGGPSDNNNKGAVWLFVSINTPVMVQIVPKVTSPTADTGIGVCVSLDGLGFKLISGSTSNAILFFNYTSPNPQTLGTWSYVSKITGPGANTGFGTVVSMSGDGTLIAAGVPQMNQNEGGVLIYMIDNTGNWINVDKLLASNPIGKASQGSSIIFPLSPTYLLMGGPTDNSSTGAAWFFIQRQGTPPVGDCPGTYSALSSSSGSDPTLAQIDSSTGWIASSTATPKNYLTINLGGVFNIINLTTQGHGTDHTLWVTRYKIDSSVDGTSYVTYGSGNETGNTDATSKKILTFIPRINAQYIRITPLQTAGGKNIGLRVCVTLGSYRSYAQQRKFVGSNSTIGSKYGTSVATGKDVPISLLISSPYENNQQGVVYAYYYDETTNLITYEQQIMGTDGTNSQFGKMISAYESTPPSLLISVPNSVDGETAWLWQLGSPPTKDIVCSVTECDSGWADCPSTFPLSDGCETNTQNDVLNCGLCGSTCSNVNGKPYCEDPSCPGLYSASSSQAGTDPELFGRLDSPRAWCSGNQEDFSDNNYLQIDLREITTITAITTQGRYVPGDNIYTWRYKIQYSSDNINYNFYGELNGNYDPTTKITNIFEPAFTARYVRIIPTGVNSQQCLRACLSREGDLPNDGFCPGTYTSNGSPVNVALLSPFPSGYSADPPGDPVIIYLGDIRTVKSFTLAPLNNPNSWTKRYKLEYSLDGTNYNQYGNGNEAGNTDQVNYVTNVFSPPFEAKTIKITPLEWYIKPSFRSCLELVPGCPGTYTTSTGDATAARIDSSSAWNAPFTDANPVDYVKIDLGGKRSIDSITFQGDGSNKLRWVTEVLVESSSDDVAYSSVNTFTANTDSFTKITVSQLGLFVRYLKITPTQISSTSNGQIGLRVCVKLVSSCGITCDSGFIDADNDASNGCEQGLPP